MQIYTQSIMPVHMASALPGCPSRCPPLRPVPMQSYSLHVQKRLKFRNGKTAKTNPTTTGKPGTAEQVDKEKASVRPGCFHAQRAESSGDVLLLLACAMQSSRFAALFQATGKMLAHFLHANTQAQTDRQTDPTTLMSRTSPPLW